MADITPAEPPDENNPAEERIAYWLKQISAALARIDNNIAILLPRTALPPQNRHPRQSK